MFSRKALCPIVVSLFVVLVCLSPLTTSAQTSQPQTLRSDPGPAAVSGLDLPATLPRSAPLVVNASNFVTLPSDFPTITVTVPANGTAPGLVFAATFGISPTPSYPYLLMLDNSGQPVYYKKLSLGEMVTDFKVLPDGTLAYFEATRNAYVIMDSSYNELGTVHTANGRPWLDEHELLKLSNGHYLVMVKQFDTVDMSAYGGSPTARVLQNIIQEVDMAGHVYFEWPILNYVPVTETTMPLTDPAIDYSHCNAIEVTADGNLLYSCRNLDSIIKINRSNGQIMWKLGGKSNNFTFLRGSNVSPAEPLQFYYQHDIRRLPNGDITLFDNHNDHDYPLSSRVLEYTLDEQNRTATLVKVWRNTPNVYSGFMGNGQMLSNGNMFVGWGGNFLSPSFTEFRADGTTKAFELAFNPLVSYRAFRFPWTGTPSAPPALVLQPSGAGITLSFSWNGWTETGPVARYRVYGGNSNAQPPSVLLGEVTKSGFENSLPLGGNDASYCFYRVVPIGSQGNGVPSTIALNLPMGAPSCFQKLALPFIPR